MNRAHPQLPAAARISGIHRLQLRDARRPRCEPPRLALRTLACRLTRRHGMAFTSLGVLGVCGFVAALGCFHARLCSSQSYLIAALGSLLALVVSLTIAILGDPYELARRRARVPR